MCRLNSIGPSIAILLLFTLACADAAEPLAKPQERRGLRCTSVSDFPVPADAKAVPLPGADFETGGKTPPGWGLGSGQVLVADDAPQGKTYGRIPTRQRLRVITPQVLGVPGTERNDSPVVYGNGTGDGDVSVEAVYVFQPPMKDK